MLAHDLVLLATLACGSNKQTKSLEFGRFVGDAMERASSKGLENIPNEIDPFSQTPAVPKLAWNKRRKRQRAIPSGLLETPEDIIGPRLAFELIPVG